MRALELVRINADPKRRGEILDAVLSKIAMRARIAYGQRRKL